jgi:predicted dithiol-disulfide oxidoreductase (DUF899 family)
MGCSFMMDNLPANRAHLAQKDLPGLSVFYKDDKGQIFHTYSTYSRGLDEFLPTYHYLDVTPKGRDESGAMSWVKRHDEYSR